MLTEKAEFTRQHILETALGLFLENGYESTTMREIAAAANCSLGLTYRYFARKEDLILALYSQMAAETNAQIKTLPSSRLADRFYDTMSARLEQATPYRDSVGALFGAVINPHSGVSLFGDQTRDLRHQTLDAFQQLVAEASDAPRPSYAESLAILLYSLHFGLILFWLLDRSPDQAITQRLLLLLRDLFFIPLRLLSFPPAANGLTQLADLIRPVFVGD